MEADLFRAWQDHPVTALLFKYLEDKREDIKELWAHGSFNMATPYRSTIENASAQGACTLIDEILTLDSNIFEEG